VTESGKENAANKKSAAISGGKVKGASEMKKKGAPARGEDAAVSKESLTRVEGPLSAQPRPKARYQCTVGGGKLQGAQSTAKGARRTSGEGETVQLI